MIPKFRAWSKQYKKMIDEVNDMTFFEGNLEFIGCRTANGVSFQYCADDIILMQSTGLFDKNSKEIFEGDIVRMRNPRDRRQIGMFQVVSVANSPMLGLLDKKLTTEIFNLYEHMRNYYEIIGNIHENPELLGVTE